MKVLLLIVKFVFFGLLCIRAKINFFIVFRDVKEFVGYLRVVISFLLYILLTSKKDVFLFISLLKTLDFSTLSTTVSWSFILTIEMKKIKVKLKTNEKCHFIGKDCIFRFY